MTDEQLQIAINKAREFVLTPLAGYATAAKAAQESAVVLIKKLEEAQALRATQHTPVGIKPGSWVEVKHD